MSDLEIDFEELQEIARIDGCNTAWANKVELIKLEYNFGEFSQVIHMFNQWAIDRAAGLHV